MSVNTNTPNRLIVKVDKEDNLTIDGTEKKIEELDAEFFENLVDKSLADEVDFCLEDSEIVSNFFATIRDGTSAGSELRKLYEKTRADWTTKDKANLDLEDSEQVSKFEET